MALLEQHFYHRTIALYTSVFGTLFDDIKISRSDGKVISVPLSYAAQQKYNVRLDENEDPNAVRYKKRTPRLAFLLTGWRRDPARSKNKLHRLTNHHTIDRETDTSVSAQYNRVPYTFTFELHATAKYIDDLLQMVEQIAVSFNPSIQVVIKDNPDLTEDSAITITMNDSQANDTFEGLFEDEREITAVFNFTLEGYLYMPTSSSGIIRTIELNYYDLDSLNKIDEDTIGSFLMMPTNLQVEDI